MILPSPSGIRSVRAGADAARRGTFVSTKRRVGVLIVAIAAACGGCADSRTRSAPPTGTAALNDAPPRTGFLGDYSGLRKSVTYANTWVERAPEIESYKSYLVDPVDVVPIATVRGVPLDTETTSFLAESFRSALAGSLSSVYTVTDAAGPGVARVRAAITEVGLYKPATGQASAEMGGASMELEVVDSVSGKRLLALVDSGSVSAYDRPGAPSEKFEHAQTTFRHWASRLLVRVGAFNGGEPTP